MTTAKAAQTKIRGVLFMDLMRAGARTMLGRHGIVPARMTWVTAREAFYCQPRTVRRPELLDGLQSVVGTRRIEAATRTQEWAHEPLINKNQGCDGAAHCSVTFFHSKARLARNSPPAASRARPRALTTRSTGGNSC